MLWIVPRANPQSVAYSHFLHSFQECDRSRSNFWAGIGACCWIWKGSDSGIWLNYIQSDNSYVEWKALGAGYWSSDWLGSWSSYCSYFPSHWSPHLCLTDNLGLGMPEVITTTNFPQSRGPICQVGVTGIRGYRGNENLSGMGKLNCVTIYWAGCWNCFGSNKYISGGKLFNTVQ